jgi:hypothetical protein
LLEKVSGLSSLKRADRPVALWISCISATCTRNHLVRVLRVTLDFAPNSKLMKGNSMVRFSRSARVKDAGKFADAVKFAKGICDYHGKTYSANGATTGKVFVRMAGGGVITWMSDYPDLATFEKSHAQVVTDKKYWSEEAKGDGLFIEGSVEECLLTEI